MSTKFKSLLSLLSNILIVIVILFAGVVTIMSYNAKQNDNVPSLFGYTTFSIQTDSMKGTINPGDLIIGEIVEDTSSLEEGTIISFYTVDKDGKYFINTHKIIDVIQNGDSVLYETQGDNEEYPDPKKVAPGDIVSVYTGVRLPILGYILTFMGSQAGFFVCIVLPVLLYTIWQVYKLIKVVMSNQKEKILSEAQTSEEMKQAIINEYLAKQKELEQQNQNSTTE